MHSFRRLAVATALTAAVAIPMTIGGSAGAQDAGDCGTGGVAASSSQTNIGGLLGSILPINAQIVAPVNAPILSPSLSSCNTNTNSVGGGGGGGTGGGGGGTGGGNTTGVGGGGSGGSAIPLAVGGAVAVSGTPHFAG
jgi:hypothetical protein